jgi:hypothetical protein
MHNRRFVVITPTTTSKKNYCANLKKCTAVMQHIAWLKWYKIKRCLKDFFFLESGKCSSLFIINVQETFVNSIKKVFELKNYFTTFIPFTMNCSIRNHYTFWFKHFLHTIAKNKNNPDKFFPNFHTFQV